MPTKMSLEEAKLGHDTFEVPDRVPQAEVGPTGEQVWRALHGASFAVLGYVTPSGSPRSSGVLYTTLGRRLYVAVAPGSWKAKHVAESGAVSVTVPASETVTGSSIVSPSPVAGTIRAPLKAPAIPAP